MFDFGGSNRTAKVASETARSMRGSFCVFTLTIPPRCERNYFVAIESRREAHLELSLMPSETHVLI